VVHLTKKRFDIHIQVRGSYNSPFGQNYLKLKEEYGVDGAWLVKRVFQDATKLIAVRLAEKADIEKQKLELVKREKEWVAGIK